MKQVIAFPSVSPGGLEAQMSGHFGHCDLFTLVTLADGEVESVQLVPNVPHEQGGCMAPVNLLASQGAQALIAGGMGMRPLMGFNSVGIEVYFNGGLSRVDQALAAFAQGQLPRFGQENTCGGGDAHAGAGGCGSH